MLGIREGGIQDYPSKTFCLTVKKNFVGDPFCAVSENFRQRKNLWIRGWGAEYHDFPSNVFCLTLPKTFVGESFSVSLISGIERFYASESYVTIFCQNIFFSHCRNVFVEKGSPSVCH